MCDLTVHSTWEPNILASTPSNLTVDTICNSRSLPLANIVHFGPLHIIVSFKTRMLGRVFYSNRCGISHGYISHGSTRILHCSSCRSLSRDDIQTVMKDGCPNLFRKVVNSAKRLRAYVHLDEGEACILT